MKIVDKNELIANLFEENFWGKLKKHILASSFDEYLENFLKERQVTIDDVKWTIHEPGYIENDIEYQNISIFSFEEFLENLKQKPDFSFCVSIKILKILKSLKVLESIKLKSDIFSLKINAKRIFSSFYNNEIIDKLNVLTVKSLESVYIDQNQLIYIEEENIDILKIRLLLFVLDYIYTYLRTVVYESQKDINTLLEVYKYEARLNLNEKRELSNDILNAIKQLRNNKYNKSRGRKNKRKDLLTNDMQAFWFVKDMAKETLAEYKNYLDTVLQKTRKSKKLAIMQVEQLCKSKKFDLISVKIITIYANEVLKHGSAETDFCISKLLDEEFHLGFFQENINDLNAFDNFKKWLTRINK